MLFCASLSHQHLWILHPWVTSSTVDLAVYLIQGHVDQGYAPPDVYPPRDVSVPRRSHGYAEEAPPGRGLPHDGPPPQQRYSAPTSYSYSPSLAESQQPVYGSGPIAGRGYSAAPAPSLDRQAYYPPQQQHAPLRQASPSRQSAPLQYADAPQQYTDAPQYARQPSYAANALPAQYAYSSAPVAEAPRGGYAEPATRGPPRRSEAGGYSNAYPGDSISRGQGYPEHQGQASHAPGASYGPPPIVDSQPQGGWAPSPREPSYLSHNAGLPGCWCFHTFILVLSSRCSTANFRCHPCSVPITLHAF